MQRFLTLALLTFALPSLALAQQTGGQPNRTHTRVVTKQVTIPSPMAAAGDTVVVIANRVKPGKRQQFEQFVQTFWGAGHRLGQTDPLIRRTFEHTRVLNPIAANEDGTYTYLFIMDPRIPGADYSITRLLNRLCPADEAARLDQMMDDALAAPQTSYTVVQTGVNRPQ